MSELEFEFKDFQHWYRMEILIQEFPEVPIRQLFKESLKFGSLLK